MRPAALGAAIVTAALVFFPRASAAQKTDKVSARQAFQQAVARHRARIGFRSGAVG
jgi:hypothetical protein